ncbi:hypothetical protein N2152v2_010453 [Parachlorella kessleri]
MEHEEKLKALTLEVEQLRRESIDQEFVVKLDQPAHLSQIQLLSHEFKIAAKVEIHVGMLPDGSQDLAAAQWKRLGHLSFDSNERSQLSARELKSVVLNGVPAQLVRFQMLRCHANRLNLYSQVGIIALNLIGDPMSLPLSSITNTATSSLASLSLGGPPFPAPSSNPAWAGAMAPAAAASMAAPQPAFSPVPHLAKSGSLGSSTGAAADLATQLNVDVTTAQKILELQERKKKAIDNEDYDEAKRLKAGIDRLRAVGTKIAQLEGKKRAAVDEEDYDLAKELKQEVDKLRAVAYSAALSGDGSAGAVYDSFKSPVPSRRGSVSGGAPAGRRGTGDAEGPLMPQQGYGAGGTDPELGSSMPANSAAELRQTPVGAGASESWVNYDERPAQAKGVYNFEGDSSAAAAPPPRRSSMASSGGRAASSGAEGGSAPAGFPADLPAPEALKPVDVKDAQPLKVATGITTGNIEGLDGNSDAFKTLARFMARMIKDKVAGVYAASLKVLRELVTFQGPKCSTRDVQTVVGELLPLLVEKASDINTRIKEQATELLVYLAGIKQAGLPSNTFAIVKPPKAQTAWKVVLGRLQLLSALLPVIGMAGKTGNEGFQLEAVMEFVGAAFGNSSAEVRGAAVQLTLQVFDIVGPSVQRYLPADLNPKVKEQIEQGMINRASGRGGAVGPLAAQRPSLTTAAAAQPARPQPPKSAAPGKKAGGTAGSPGARPAAVGSMSPPAAQPSSAAYPPSPGSPGMSPSGDDDPAPFEAELRAREARLGPSHPDVAEALSNLAIIHNQRGDTGRALPLYERALAIWEAACGPDHPDVAHTLTDIAVIHLEQGRDDIGRPLLERALAIQEKHLGPDHPDVVAIRDVLNEEA